MMLAIGGNENVNDDTLDSVEAFDGTAWDLRKVTDYPTPIAFHCTVKLNSSSLLSIGGFFGSIYSDQTFFFDLINNVWTPGPHLNTKRSSLACATFKWENPSTGKEETVVVWQPEVQILSGVAIKAPPNFSFSMNI